MKRVRNGLLGSVEINRLSKSLADSSTVMNGSQYVVQGHAAASDLRSSAFPCGLSLGRMASFTNRKRPFLDLFQR